MANNRIFYATHKVGIKPDDTPGVPYNTIHGLQSVGISTNMNLEQIFELGQLAVYENIEDIPDIEVSLSKFLDGYPLIFHRATQTASSPTLEARSTEKCFLGLGIFADTTTLAAGTPEQFMQSSGMFVSSVSYNFSVDDNFTEDVTLVGNNKVWANDPDVVNPSDQLVL